MVLAWMVNCTDVRQPGRRITGKTIETYLERAVYFEGKATVTSRMKQEFIERVFSNPTVLGLGAPLISACLRLGWKYSCEYESSHHAESVSLHSSLAWLLSMIWPLTQSFKRSIRRLLLHPRFGRKVTSSATSC